jgi:transcriptional regulator with XRE-family HTH domain
VTARAVAHVRKFLGQRPRVLRKQRALSQEGLGKGSGLSGKFIGEVERGEKSISIDSLYHISVALAVPLRDLTNVGDKPRTGPTEEAERIYALVSGRRRPEDVRKAYNVLRAMFSRTAGPHA